MAFTPVKSYTFPTGGLRATNESGPIAAKQRYGNLAGLLSGGLRATDASGPTPQGFNTGIAAAPGTGPSDVARQQVAGGGDFNPPSPDQLVNDPILQQIRDAGKMAVQQARQGALANAENSIIGYGATTVPDSLKALYGSDTSNPILAALTDSNTADAAAANPDSTLRQLARTDLQNNAGIDQGENANNLFYSSDRGNKLGAEADQYRGAQGQAAQNLAGLLGQANQGVLDTEDRANQDYLNGLSGAWDRYLSLAQLLGGSGGGGSPAPPAGGPALNQNTGGLPLTVSDTSSPLYGQPNPLFNLSAAQAQGPAALKSFLAAKPSAPTARFY